MKFRTIIAATCTAVWEVRHEATLAAATRSIDDTCDAHGTTARNECQRTAALASGIHAAAGSARASEQRERRHRIERHPAVRRSCTT